DAPGDRTSRRHLRRRRPGPSERPPGAVLGTLAHRDGRLVPQVLGGGRPAGDRDRRAARLMSPGRAPARLARRALLALGLAGLVLSAPAPQAAEPGEPAIPEAVGYVNDLAEVMDQTARAKLEA